MNVTTNQITEKALKEGKEFYFTDAEDHSFAEVHYGDTWGGNKEFMIQFNGVVVHMSKTFTSLQNKLSLLQRKHSLFY